MRDILIPAAAAAAFFAAVLLRREILRLASSAPTAGAQDDVLGQGFPRALLVPPIPIAIFLLLALGIMITSSFEAAVVGLLLTTAVMAGVLPVLCGELMLWAHRARRLAPDAEATTIERLRRAGALVNEVWVSAAPVVVFWRATLLSPAIVVRSRVLIWRDAIDGLRPAGAGGVALAAPGGRFWAWALLPFVSAMALRARDPFSLIPWWTFGAVGAVIALAALPDALGWLRVRRSLRTDAGARDEIDGALAFGLLESWLAASRGDGVAAQLSSASSWQRAIARARAAAKLSGVDAAYVDARVAALLAARSAPPTSLDGASDVGFP